MVTIEYLADHPAHLPTLAAWLHAQWGSLNPGSTVETRVESLRKQLQRAEVPCAFVALDGDRPAGSASLVEHDMEDHPEWSPWLASVYVHRDFRRRGIGSALAERVAEEARALGVGPLYLFTLDQERLYRRLGWRRLREERYHDWTVTVMVRDLGGR
jgi:predicted N-acetyltransferase YhbS